MEKKKRKKTKIEMEKGRKFCCFTSTKQDKITEKKKIRKKRKLKDG